MATTYILHLYHPDGPCKRLLFHSRVQAMKTAQAWLAEHFADRQEQMLRDIMAETDYFNPVYLAPLGDSIPQTARFLVRIGEGANSTPPTGSAPANGVYFLETAEQAWRLVDSYALANAFPANYLKKLHSFLLQYGYEEKLKVLFYPIEWGDELTTPPERP